jgi:TonB family protein
MAPWSGKADGAPAPDSSTAAQTPASADTTDVAVVTTSSSRRRSMALAAAAVLAIATAGAPQVGRRLGIQWSAVTIGSPQSSAASGAALSSPTAAPATDVTLEPAPPPESTATQPTTEVRRVPSRARQQDPRIPEEAPLAAAAAVRAVAPAPEPPAPAAPAALPAAPPAAPTGRFFEATDVDEIPRIVRRVEPQVPGELAGRSFNDVVVVRVLVSQSGHPFRVSLLRKSKLGPSLDEAVVDAVTQWTFAPAQTKGEAVSSWYNIGLPLGGAPAGMSAGNQAAGGEEDRRRE